MARDVQRLTVLSAALTATIGTALNVAINLATSSGRNFWAWAGVVVLTALSAILLWRVANPPQKATADKPQAGDIVRRSRRRAFLIIGAAAVVGILVFVVLIVRGQGRHDDRDDTAESTILIDRDEVHEKYGVAINGSPGSMVISGDGKRAFFNLGSDLMELDTSTNKIVMGVPRGVQGFSDLAITPDGRYIFATASEATAVSVFDTVANSIVAVIPITDSGDSLYGIAASKDGRRVYVTKEPFEGPSMVVVIDVATRGIVGEIPVDGQPSSIDTTPDGRWVYVVTDDGLAVIDSTIDAVINVLSIPGAINVAVAPDGESAFVVDDKGVTVVGVDGQFVAYTVPVPGCKGYGISVEPTGTNVFIAMRNKCDDSSDYSAGQVVEVDTFERSVNRTYDVGIGPTDVDVMPNGLQAYVVNNGDSSISILDIGR